LFHALRTACWSVVDAPPPRLIEITRAPCEATQLMQLATSAVLPVPSGPPSALQTTRSALNATPATPVALLALAAIVPATWVPWSLSSAHWPTWIVPDMIGSRPWDRAQATV
jgi:hypothetical protein